MVHEFVSAILENRRSAIDADKAANWTMAGICAHESAMKNGEKVIIPETFL
jgi:2-oxoglutarate dehydrogenase complex dehydrogenase (E1) component-like enzyme